MTMKWMTYEELVADGWKEGEAVVVRTYLGALYVDCTTTHPDYHARSLHYDRTVFLRLPKEDWESKYRYIVENSTVAEGDYDVLAVNDRTQDSRIVAHSIPTREAAEAIAAIYEGAGV